MIYKKDEVLSNSLFISTSIYQKIVNQLY